MYVYVCVCVCIYSISCQCIKLGKKKEQEDVQSDTIWLPKSLFCATDLCFPGNGTTPACPWEVVKPHLQKIICACDICTEMLHLKPKVLSSAEEQSVENLSNQDLLIFISHNHF